MLNPEFVGPFFEECQKRVDEEVGFADRVRDYERNRSQGGWKGDGKGGGRGGSKSLNSFRPVSAAQRTDPHGSSIEIGKAAPANTNEWMQAAKSGTAMQTLVVIREADQEGEP